MAAATSLRGGSVDQRLPTRWTSPRRSKSCSRASAFSLLRPAARAAIAVENEPGSLRSAARRRSGRSARAPQGAVPPARAAQRWRNGFQRRRWPAAHRRIVPEPGSAAAAQDDRLPLGRADDHKPTPSTTRAAHAATPSGVFYLDQVFSTQPRSPLTIERRSRGAVRFPTGRYGNNRRPSTRAPNRSCPCTWASGPSP